MTAALETDGGDESLDFGTGANSILRCARSRSKKKHSRLHVGLRVLLLRALDLPPDDVLPDIVLLAQVEELPDLRRPLGTQPLGEDVVGKTRDLLLTLLDENEGENGDVGSHDTSTD